MINIHLCVSHVFNFENYNLTNSHIHFFESGDKGQNETVPM